LFHGYLSLQPCVYYHEDSVVLIFVFLLFVCFSTKHKSKTKVECLIRMFLSIFLVFIIIFFLNVSGMHIHCSFQTPFENSVRNQISLAHLELNWSLILSRRFFLDHYFSVYYDAIQSLFPFVQFLLHIFLILKWQNLYNSVLVFCSFLFLSNFSISFILQICLFC